MVSVSDRPRMPKILTRKKKTRATEKMLRTTVLRRLKMFIETRYCKANHGPKNMGPEDQTPKHILVK